MSNDKKWYNYFVTVDQGAAGGDQPAAEASPAQAVADIAARVAASRPAAPPPPVSNLESFDEIFAAAEIRTPDHGYTIFKVADMLASDYIRNLPLEVKRSSVLVALEAAGVKVQEIVEDAVRRDKALDTFERVQQKALDALDARKAEENRQIQAELDRVVADHKARMEANTAEVQKEKERFYGWLLRKQQEEQRIADAVAPFVTENPITRGPAPK